MNNMLQVMLDKYSLINITQKKDAVKEIIQEIVLSGLYRAGFFEVASFYGGTALRIFHGLDRFSEDLDFSLRKKDDKFDFSKYFSVLEKELKSFDLNVEIVYKEKSIDSNVKSAFVKANTKEMILHFYSNEEMANQIISNETIKIKFEVDTNPAPYANYEVRYKTMPTPYAVNMYDLPSLFAGKIHAVLCRAWKSRIKGRDLYDFIFYISKSTKVNIKNLRAKLIQSGYLNENDEYLLDDLKNDLKSKFENLDYESAKLDVIRFLSDKKKVNIWCKEFFISLLDDLKESN